jgi:hypothetical protein
MLPHEYGWHCAYLSTVSSGRLTGRKTVYEKLENFLELLD